MTGRRRRLGVITALAAGVAVTCSISGAGADPLASAKSRAAALNREVQSLTDRAEMASQRYDGIEARLGAAVNSDLTADQAAAADRAASNRAQRRIDDRVQALYASGGSINLLADMLTGSTDQAFERAELSAAALTVDTTAMSRESAAASSAAAVAGRKELSARQIARLQAAAARERSRVTTLLAKERTALRDADATVRRLAMAQAKAAAAEAAAAFQAEFQQAGGTLDPGGSIKAPNQVAAAAIAAARSRLGVPYVWGATGPDAFDCSGLTQWSYAHAGVALPRTAAEQWWSGPHPSLAQLEPGDLLFWAFVPGDPATIHHVAIYIGNGDMIAAPHTGENVQIQPVYMDGFFGATRPWANHL